MVLSSSDDDNIHSASRSSSCQVCFVVFICSSRCSFVALCLLRHTSIYKYILERACCRSRVAGTLLGPTIRPRPILLFQSLVFLSSIHDVQKPAWPRPHPSTSRPLSGSTTNTCTAPSFISQQWPAIISPHHSRCFCLCCSQLWLWHCRSPPTRPVPTSASTLQTSTALTQDRPIPMAMTLSAMTTTSRTSLQAKSIRDVLLVYRTAPSSVKMRTTWIGSCVSQPACHFSMQLPSNLANS